MPIKEVGKTDDPSLKKGHLAVLTTADGEAFPIVEGMFVFVIPDPDNLSKVTPLILLKVGHKKLEFACGCGNKQCSRRIEYRMEARGHHPFQTVGQTRED